jgi:N utilization substance protein A
MMEDLLKTIAEVEREKGIKRDVLIEALEAAMLTAARKKKGLMADLEAQFDEERGEIHVIEFKTVVEQVENPDLEITLAQALEIEDDPDLQVGDQIGLLLPTEELGRIAAQTAKQVIIQRVREADRENIYSSFKDRKGELVSGSVRRVERGNVVIDLLKSEAVMPYREQVPRENYRVGDRVECLVLDVRQEVRGHQIVLSRAHPDFVTKLFAREVPEIHEGIITVRAVAREAGTRTKFAVSSRDSDVDPVGACVGMKGIRVQAVVQELRNEKIDIVPWSDDPVRFVCAALQPAEVSRVLVDEGAQRMEIVIPDDQLSLAIGRRGQNVRLAAELTGWKLELSSESKMNERRSIAYESLGRIEGLGDLLLQTLYNYGYQSAVAVADGDEEVLAQIPGVDTERAAELVEGARVAVASEQAEAGIRMELARDQAQRDRAIVDAVDAMGDGGFGLLSGLDEASEGLLSACAAVGLSDPADLYFEALSIGLEDFALRFSLTESRTWVLLHRIEKALVEAAAGEWGLLIDEPRPEDYANVAAERAAAAAAAVEAAEASEIAETSSAPESDEASAEEAPAS